MKKVLVTGVSGTGKSTVCRELSERGYNTISIDGTPDLSYWVHKETGVRLTKKADFSDEFLQTYEWVCDMEVLKKLTDEIEGTVVICGNVENILECIDFADKTLLLQCSPDTFLARIAKRDDNDYGKDRDAQDFLMSYYKADNQKCLEAGAIVIDAEQTIDQVVADVISHIS